MTSFAAFGNVAELALPPLFARALQRPLAVAVHATGKKAAVGAVVTLVAHVTSVHENQVDPIHLTFEAANSSNIRRGS